MLSKKDIEELATGAVKRYFNTCNLVSPHTDVSVQVLANALHMVF